jgi:PAS domain S-box-containing protein
MSPSPASAGRSQRDHPHDPISLGDLAQALDHSDEGFALTDPEGNYVYINHAHLRMYGYDRPEDLLGRSWRTLYTADWVRHFEEEVLPLIPRDKVWRGQVLGRRRNGSSFLTSITLTLLPDGKITCNCRDESANSGANSHHALRELGERLVTAIPANFRHPLDTVSGYASFLLAELANGRHPATDALREGLHQIDHAGRRLAEQVKRLDLVARLAAEDGLDGTRGENLPADEWPVRLTRAIGRRARAADREPDIHLDLAPAALAMAYAALECVVLELLANALQSSRPGDAVRLTGRLDGNRYVLRVCDEGVGLPPDGLDPAAGRPCGQTRPGGFGLAVVQYILRRSGGRLEHDHNGTCATCLRLEIPRRA